ncbi:stage II sporulation protein D [Paenibacillus sp. A14]|uniref:stage II sporulation protein D n=2 Tax=Paenibacillus TaxID=44249 RepID=UPI002FE1457A
MEVAEPTERCSENPEEMRCEMKEQGNPVQPREKLIYEKNRIKVKLDEPAVPKEEAKPARVEPRPGEEARGGTHGPPSAGPAAGETPLRMRLAPGAPLRPSFRRRGRKGGALAAGLAALVALAALAVLLPALLAGRTGAPPAPHLPAAAQPPQARTPAAAGGAGAERLAPAEGSPAEGRTLVRVYLSRTGSVESLPLEQYVTGVLAAEMPADFELEALKAQAVAARTFIVRRLAARDTSGIPGGKADVKDTVDHQAYLSRKTLEKWKRDGKTEQLARLERAVQETQGIVMTYQGQPITASFFSASGGYTENSEEYWSLRVPYLRSVASPWDAGVNPRNEVTVTLPVSEVLGKLGQSVPVIPVSGGGTEKTEYSDRLFRILSYTSGRRVKQILVGGKTYTGREVREKLGLRSSQFRLDVDGRNVKITTYGYGHGVGMSQWGANGMAKNGHTAAQILKHYYTGISFEGAADLLK